MMAVADDWWRVFSRVVMVGVVLEYQEWTGL